MNGQQSRLESRLARGRAAEQAALEFLESRGYRLVDRNVRRGRWEIDLIVRAGETLVFVEVRSRSNQRFGSAAETVGRRKQRHLVNAAELWLRGHPQGGPIRFDVIDVDTGHARSRCRHFVDAFRSPV